MISDPNSDSEQCTESKLGYVHSEHTQSPGYMHAVPKPSAGRRVMAHWAPYRGALGIVSWHTGHRIVALGRHVVVVSQRALAMSWPMLAVSWGRVVAPCCTPLRPVSRYNSLYRDSN